MAIVKWLYGYMAIWLYGYMALWLYGYMAKWLNGYRYTQILTINLQANNILNHTAIQPYNHLIIFLFERFNIIFILVVLIEYEYVHRYHYQL